MSGYTTVPYTIAYANEMVTDPLGFEVLGGKLRLTYRPSKPGDWVKGPAAPSWDLGILRARVRDLLSDKPAQRGPERMRKLNTRRQWRCMDKLLCQVCGEPATDPDTGLIPWLLAHTVFEATSEQSGRTNAPPTCWSCIPKALEQCPMLAVHPILCTVASISPAGVLADIYQPGSAHQPVLMDHNVFVPWEWREYHPGALAVAQVVELHGMRPVGGPRASVRPHIPL
ncbi:hypothetical protein FH608_045870 [Nonomuraea phyllanthi]|uniref:Uncharacterized protein n=1 Tax=Nonomuraea phyllanthi TaxID=2219224 RepID=A0A5C4V5U9_9ACTN|nr:hypothetical protein [Nonomuraea phyllanthi]KAB8186825.1 hypothetical protein FH608_045870 [Nonomuraea phyllanthi]